MANISRRRIAKKNAEKQRTRYTQRKGELPPIVNTRGRYSMTDKEMSNLKGIVQRQSEKRKAAKAITKEKRAPQVPSIDASKKNSIKAPEPQALKPVKHFSSTPPQAKVSGPRPMGGGISDHIDRYNDTGDKKHLDAAKRAALHQYAQDTTFAATEYHTPEFRKRGREEAKEKLKTHLNMIKDIKYPPGSGFLNRIRRIFAEGRNETIDQRIARNAERADHHANEYYYNPKGPQSSEHISKADRHAAVYQRLKHFKKTGKIHEGAGFDDKDQARMTSNIGRKLGPKGTASDEKRFDDIYARWKKMKKKSVKESLKEIGDRLEKNLRADVQKRKELVAKNKEANPERYVERPNSPETGLKRPYPRKLREETVDESVSGRLTALGKWLTGRSRAKAKAAEWSKKADTLKSVSGHLYGRSRQHWAEVRRSRSEGDAIGTEFHKRHALKYSEKSSQNAYKAIDYRNAAWNAKHDHKKLPKFGRKLAEACSKRVNPKEVLDDAEYKKMKKDKKNPALRKALGKRTLKESGYLVQGHHETHGTRTFHYSSIKKAQDDLKKHGWKLQSVLPSSKKPKAKK